jgi:formylglycine-generating enzyme required for sulfatase activity
MTRPEDDLTPEERFASWLCDYDDALAGDGAAAPGVEGVPSEVRDDLRHDRDCIDLLHRVWQDAQGEVSTDRDRSGVDASAPTRTTPPPAGCGPGSAADAELPKYRLPGFQILEKVGQGGMGVVFRAIQLSLNREVAVKILPPALAHDEHRLRRFRNEAQVAATLTDANILPVIDILDVGGLPVLVMPFVDGTDLGHVIADRRAAARGDPDPLGYRHPWADLDERDYLAQVLEVLDRVADAVAKLHGVGIIHRDVKPSNILLDRRGNVWLTDFGLARLGDDSTLTGPGSQLGSPGYMSPEQWSSRDDLDARVDVFGLGATAYFGLTRRLPYGTSAIAATAALAPSPRRYTRDLGPDFGAVILKALEPDRRNRYDSATEFRDDWQRVRHGMLPQARRVGLARRLARRLRHHPWGVADAIAAVAMIAALIVGWRGRGTPAAGPGGMMRSVVLNTVPPGARVVMVPIEPVTGVPRPDRAVRPPAGAKTPLTIPDVPPGDYLVVAEIKGLGRFHEVLRHVPAAQDDLPRLDRLLALNHYYWTVLKDGRVQLPAIVLPRGDPPAGTMARFEGDPAFLMGETDKRIGLPTHTVSVGPFLLDTHEVTVGAFTGVVGGLPEPFVREGHSSRPDDPLVEVTYDQAVAFAEQVGKRLPTEEEYEFAATLGGRSRFPWGDSDAPLHDSGGNPRWRFGQVGPLDDFDQTPTTPPVLGLFSNVAEWTWSLHRSSPGVAQMREFSETRAVRGAPPSIVEGKAIQKREILSPRFPQSNFRSKPLPGLGFRCARSAGPRFLDE